MDLEKENELSAKLNSAEGELEEDKNRRYITRMEGAMIRMASLSTSRKHYKEPHKKV